MWVNWMDEGHPKDTDNGVGIHAWLNSDIDEDDLIADTLSSDEHRDVRPLCDYDWASVYRENDWSSNTLFHVGREVKLPVVELLDSGKLCPACEHLWRQRIGHPYPDGAPSGARAEVIRERLDPTR